MVTWEATTIGDLLEFKNGLNKGKEFFGQGTPIVNYMDVYKNRGLRAEQLRGRVTLSAEEIKRFAVHKGDVFFTRTSETPEEVGYASVMLDEVDDCVFSGFVLRGRPITDRLDIGYCQYAFMTKDVRKAIMLGCTYTTRALTNGRQLSAIEIQLPEKSEQRLIATALSDADKYISALENLIAKKRAVKQGTMQELLTGKRRLPGFDGEWKTKTWKDVLDGFSSGATPYRGKLEYYKGFIKWVSSGELNYNKIYDTFEHISDDARMDTCLTLHPPGTFLMAITGLEAAGTRGSCAILGTEATTNQSCMAIYSTERMTTEYLYHYYVLFGDSLAFQYCQGTKQQSYTAKIVKELPVFYPTDVTEQSTIATVLSDMDAEIDALTVKLNKAKHIKQGMMSELLSGRIRLVEQEAPSEATTVPKVVELPKQEAKGHNQQIDDAVMIAGIVNVLYSDKFPLGRKRVQKCLYLLRRHQDESTAAFKKKAAGPYADEVRYKGGEPIARGNQYITTTTDKSKGTTFARGKNISQALGYIKSWGKQGDIKWVVNKLKFKKTDELELLATVDMAICDLEEAGIDVSVASIKHLIATNEEWKAKLEKQTFSDANIARAIRELQNLL